MIKKFSDRELLSFQLIDLLTAVWYNYPENYRIDSDVEWQSVLYLTLKRLIMYMTV